MRASYEALNRGDPMRRDPTEPPGGRRVPKGPLRARGDAAGSRRGLHVPSCHGTNIFFGTKNDTPTKIPMAFCFSNSPNGYAHEILPRFCAWGAVDLQNYLTVVELHVAGV